MDDKHFEKTYDIEKQPHLSEDDSRPESLVQHNGKLMTSDGSVPGETFAIGDSMYHSTMQSSSATHICAGWYAKAQRFAGRLNIEQRGIERVPENERTDTGFRALLNAGTMVFDYAKARKNLKVC